jgi:hypothetical protein
MAFKNSPRIVTVGGKRMMEVYKHQPLTFDHFDTHCQIQSNGRIKLTKPVDGSEEYDEIEIPASLVFKLVGLLKDTRSVEFVEVNEDSKAAALKQTE